MSLEASYAVKKFSAHKGGNLLLLLMIADYCDPFGGMCWAGIPALAKDCRMGSRNIRYCIKDLIDSGELVCYGRHRKSGNWVYGLQLPGLAPRKKLMEQLSEAAQFDVNDDTPPTEMTDLDDTPPVDADDTTPVVQSLHSDLDDTHNGVSAKRDTEKCNPLQSALYIDPSMIQENDPPLPPNGGNTATSLPGGVSSPKKVDRKEAAAQRKRDAALFSTGKASPPPTPTPTPEKEPTALKPAARAKKGRVSSTRPSKVMTSAEAAAFDTWWEAYPVKRGKQDCLGWWRKHHPDQELLERMLTAISLEKENDPDWAAGEVPPCPYPFTWLNRRAWEDEIKPRKTRRSGPESTSGTFSPDQHRKTYGSVPRGTPPEASPDAPESTEPPRQDIPATITAITALYEEFGFRADDQPKYIRVLHSANVRQEFRNTIFYPPEGGTPGVIMFTSESQRDGIMARTAIPTRKALVEGIRAEYHLPSANVRYLTVGELREAMKGAAD